MDRAQAAGRSASAAAPFALGRALRALATLPHAFTLESSQLPGLRVEVEAVPLDRHELPGGVQIARFCRTALVLRDGVPVQRMTATTEVDLGRRCILSNELDGRRVTAEDAAALPEHARVGDSGELFAVVAPDADDGRDSVLRWSLEAWPGGRALWCLHVQDASTGLIASSECWVITPAGEIVGRVQRVHRGPGGEVDAGGDAAVLELRSDGGNLAATTGALRA